MERLSGERYKGIGLESWSIAEDFEAGFERAILSVGW